MGVEQLYRKAPDATEYDQCISVKVKTVMILVQINIVFNLTVNQVRIRTFFGFEF